MNTHIFKGPLLRRLLHAQPTTRRGTCCVLGQFSFHFNSTNFFSLAQNPRAHQAEGTNSLSSPIIAFPASNFFTLLEIQVMMQECMDAAEALLS
ncbi:hypothetical protein Csa_016766 [Cucumis sativus]|uniref:Uncharacterized protein n=1 Tax=Cucumis sativus TaxID=3659 RepID=A0A0A0K9W9_CUCSA|nr:hypothetical protein Csa_016766 [Cucumis sativus]